LAHGNVLQDEHIHNLKSDIPVEAGKDVDLEMKEENTKHMTMIHH
jgi:hypothetical protein